MKDVSELPHDFVARSAVRHSLGWLVAANLVGVLLAAFLVWPDLGDALAPFTYGRWMPLHLNWQLYGWCALPLVAVLLLWGLAPQRAYALRETQLALHAWTLALIFGGVSWLAGTVSGKLFVDWHGPARVLLPIAMLVLWSVLALHLRTAWSALPAAERLLRAGFLALLLPVPFLLFWASGRAVFPAVNPDSGGATGASLLGSTLGIVTIFLLLPTLLRVSKRAATMNGKWIWGALAWSWVAFAAIDHGHASHHAVVQDIALGLLLAWIPLLAWHWRAFAWTREAAPWIWAAFAWWTLLVLSGWLTFLPGWSETMKFTHWLVAHAHLAMAGLVTSVNGAILTTLTRRAAPRGVFAVWQVATALHIALLGVIGANEAEAAAELFRSADWSQALFAGRLAAGVLMTLASLRWWIESFRHE